MTATPERATSPAGESTSSEDDVKPGKNEQKNQSETTKSDGVVATTGGGAAAEEASSSEKQQPDQQEVILIQDTSFTVKIQTPGVAESFELQVSSMELVQEIHQVLMDREDTCHRTCFSLYVEGR